MKLNKVLALALSGVMAVSMLAGCSNNSGNGGQNGEEQPPVADTTIAGVLNNKMSDEKVDYVSFDYSTELQAAVEQVLRVNGGLESNTDKEDISNDVASYMGVTRTLFNALNSRKVGTAYAVTTQIEDAVTEEAAKKNIATAVYDLVKDLEEEEDGTNNTFNYSYSGEVAMVSAEDNGVPVYMAVVIVTCETTASALD